MHLVPDNIKKCFILATLLSLITGMSIIYFMPLFSELSKDFGIGHDGYIQLARSLANGDGYVFEQGGAAVFHRPPFYPLVLTGIALLPGPLERPGLVVLQSLMLGCVAALIFKNAQELFSRKTAQFAVVIFLLYPWAYWHVKNPMTPVMQALLYILFFTLIRAELASMRNNIKLKPWIRCIGLGIVAAALALTHGAMLAVCGGLLSILFMTGIFYKKWQRVKSATFIGLVMIVLIAPWTYRNWVVFHRFIPVTRGVGLAYLNGVSHWAINSDEQIRPGESYIDASLRICGIAGTKETVVHWKGLKDISLDDQANETMVKHILENPRRFAITVLLNSIEYYFPAFTYRFRVIKRCSIEEIALTIFHTGLWLLGLVGIWRMRHEKRYLCAALGLLVVIWLYAIWYFPFAAYIPHLLYTFGTIPFLTILAGCGLIGNKLATESQQQ